MTKLITPAPEYGDGNAGTVKGASETKYKFVPKQSLKVSDEDAKAFIDSGYWVAYESDGKQAGEKDINPTPKTAKKRTTTSDGSDS